MRGTRSGWNWVDPDGTVCEATGGMLPFIQETILLNPCRLATLIDEGRASFPHQYFTIDSRVASLAAIELGISDSDIKHVGDILDLLPQPKGIR